MQTLNSTLPFLFAWANTSAAPLLIIFVMYKGQLACFAIVMARYTASASTCRHKTKYKQRTSQDISVRAEPPQAVAGLQLWIVLLEKLLALPPRGGSGHVPLAP